jgi:NAD(P)-dependent dehydrogenase (short-subunit alcohol dehydrogenase family)
MQGATLVTGAVGGMGRACALELARRGARLVLSDLDASALAALRDELRAEGVGAQVEAGDVTEPVVREGLVAAAREAGGLAALVHTAGLSPSMADAARIFRVNLEAAAALVDALQPLAREGAAAVLFASQAGILAANAATPAIDALLDEAGGPDWYARLLAEAGEEFAGQPGGAYALSKRGVQRLAVARAPAWGERGARILSLSPGIIDTGMGRQEYAQQPAMKAMVDRTPAGRRMGRPEEIAAVVAFLCSSDASFMTGVDVLIDGGSTYQMLGGFR